jgi:beta-lactamase class A
VFAQYGQIPDSLRIDSALSAQLQVDVDDLELNRNFDIGEDGVEQISLAVIDLSKETPRLGGVNAGNFIYPASVYKMYVAAEILHQISDGDYSLWSPIVAKSPNTVDRSKQIDWDPRPLLHDGDTVTVNYLLDLMITRSDNSAANCLIDLATRDSINAFIHAFGWYGSEVTRKYLSRKFEDPGYENIRGTETCALHAADFMYRIYTGRLFNHWVSEQMKSFLARQLDTTKLAPGLPANAMFYHKTGWYSFWTNDVGIVDNGTTRYVVACFLPVREVIARPKMKELSQKIFEALSKR